MLRCTSFVSLCIASLSSVAAAQAPADPAAVPAPAGPEIAMAPTAPPAASPPAVTAGPSPAPAPAPRGPSLRNGFSLSVGQELGSGPSEGLSGQLYGIDWRIGAKLSDALAVYLDTHLSFGTAEIGAASGTTGNFATAVIGEYTLPQRIFVGGGAGYGVLNNPDGPLVQARVGYYPFEASSTSKVRRLNVAFDARFYFPGEAIGTVSHYALSLGYDRF